MKQDIQNIIDGYISNGMWAVTILTVIGVMKLVKYISLKKINFSKGYVHTVQKKKQELKVINNTVEILAEGSSENVFFEELINNHKMMLNSRW